jgi:hypothetical protein
MFCGMPWSVVSYDSIPSAQYDPMQNYRITQLCRAPGNLQYVTRV